MTLFQKKQKRRKRYTKKQELKKKEIHFPRVSDKLILMVQLFGLDIARVIIEFLMQANKQDTIDFRECNISSILSNYENEWSQVMRQIRLKNTNRYGHGFNHYYNYYNNYLNNLLFNYQYDYYEPINNTYYTIKYKYDKDYYYKQINEILPHDKFRLTNREHKLRKSFQKHETKRRNKMIQIR